MSLSNSLISGVFCVGMRFRVGVLDQYREVTLPYRRLVSDACHNIEILITHHNSLILALLKPPFLRLALLLGLPVIESYQKKTPEINELDRDTKILKI